MELNAKQKDFLYRNGYLIDTPYPTLLSLGWSSYFINNLEWTVTELKGTKFKLQISRQCGELLFETNCELTAKDYDILLEKGKE